MRTVQPHLGLTPDPSESAGWYFIQARQEAEVEATRRHVEELGQANEHQIHQLQDEVAAKEDSRRQLVVSNLPICGVTCDHHVIIIFQRCVEELQAEIQAKNEHIADLIAIKNNLVARKDREIATQLEVHTHTCIHTYN